tara:strand:+ start:5479 stop:6237 length:759 start_codon:yes stop_codon:yes gene_type:complete
MSGVKKKISDFKKKNKSKNISMPNQLVVIKNSMKDTGNWVENWKEPKNRSIGHIPHPMRLLAMGSVGKGKTNTMKNVFLKHQSSKNPFKRLYIITCSLDNKEWDNCEPDDIFTNIPPLELFTNNTKDKTLLIFDDWEMTKLDSNTERDLSTLFRYVSSHCNLSIMCGYQSWFDCHNICKKCANCFIVYKPNSRRELEEINNRCGLDKGILKDIFKTVCKGDFDSVMIDHTIGTPAKIRKNIYEKIDLNEDSD